MSPCQLGDGRQLISRAQAAGHDLLAQFGGDHLVQSAWRARRGHSWGTRLHFVTDRSRPGDNVVSAIRVVLAGHMTVVWCQR
jgi:hypothetical protein